MDILVIWLIELVIAALDIYKWVVIAAVVVSWLVAFNVINNYSPFVRQVTYVIDRLTEPALRPIRRYIPDLGGIDISPVVLLFAIWAIQYLLVLVRYRVV